MEELSLVAGTIIILSGFVFVGYMVRLFVVPPCSHRWVEKERIGCYNKNIGMNVSLIYVRQCAKCKKIRTQKVSN